MDFFYDRTIIDRLKKYKSITGEINVINLNADKTENYTQERSQGEFQGFQNPLLLHLDPSLCQFLEQPHCDTYH